MRLRRICVRAEGLAGLYGGGPRSGARGVYASRAHARRAAGRIGWVGNLHEHVRVDSAFRAPGRAALSGHDFPAGHGAPRIVLWRGAALRFFREARRRGGRDDCVGLFSLAQRRFAREQRRNFAAGRLEILLRDRLSYLVFDVPNDARGLRLLVSEDDPETRFVIGHENSLWHKKIYFNVDARESTPEATK